TTTASVVDNGTVFAVPGGYLLRKFVGPAYSSWFSNWAGIVTFMSAPNRHLVVDTVLQATSVLNIKSNSTLGLPIPEESYRMLRLHVKCLILSARHPRCSYR
ncbi:hypothetical protein ACYCB7_27110, partial [Klebsiella pneumoniae]